LQAADGSTLVCFETDRLCSHEATLGASLKIDRCRRDGNGYRGRDQHDPRLSDSAIIGDGPSFGDNVEGLFGLTPFPLAATAPA